MPDPEPIDWAKLYNEFLDSPWWWNCDICDSCGYIYTHPINYCVKCPGRLVKPKWTWLNFIDHDAKQNGSYGAYVGEFRQWLRGSRGLVVDNATVEGVAYETVRQRRKAIQ